MCIAIPSKIINIDGAMPTIDVQGGQRQLSPMLLAEEAAIDDYVLVHGGFAIQLLNLEAGLETLALFDEILNQTGSSGLPNA